MLFKFSVVVGSSHLAAMDEAMNFIGRGMELILVKIFILHIWTVSFKAQAISSDHTKLTHIYYGNTEHCVSGEKQ